LAKISVWNTQKENEGDGKCGQRCEDWKWAGNSGKNEKMPKLDKQIAECEMRNLKD